MNIKDLDKVLIWVIVITKELKYKTIRSKACGEEFYGYKSRVF
jgi:hypothetical protein